MSRCLYVSFFTPDYIEPASRLVQSLHKYDLDYEVQKTFDSGQWITNCAYKPQFVREQLARSPGRPVVWTDADSEVMCKPLLFELEVTPLEKCDAAVCEFTWARPSFVKKETLSGTAFFAPTPAAARLVDIWCALQTVSPKEMDQRTLAKAVELARVEGVVVAVLPVEYCFIFDLHQREYPSKQAVFQHYQHSRVRKINEVKR